MFPREIVTDRLSLRPAHQSIRPLELYELCQSEGEELDEVSQFVSWLPHRTPHEAAQFLNTLQEGWNEHSEAGYGIYMRESDELMGLCTLSFDWDKNRAELSVWLAEEFRVDTYAAEQAFAVVETAFDVYELNAVLTRVAEPNEDYQETVETYMSVLGGKQLGMIPSDVWSGSEVYASMVYGVVRDDYQKAFNTERDSVLQELKHEER